MPKLAVKDRKKAQKAEAVSGDFEPMPPGKYIGQLSQVEAKNSAAGNPMWVAEFEEIHDLEGDKQPGRLWYNLNLPQDEMPDGYQGKGKKSAEDTWESYQAMCAGRIKAFFEAFGYELNSDTDEFIGERVVLQVGVRTIQNGPKAGQSTNSVNGVAPLDSVEFEEGEDGGKGSDPDEF